MGILLGVSGGIERIFEDYPVNGQMTFEFA